jgi:HK97 family phage major capsid protein
MKISDLKQKRAAILDEAAGIAKSAEAESRNLSTEEREKYEAKMNEARDLRERIERAAEIAAEQGVALTPEGAPVSDPSVGMSNKEVRQYSFIRAINASISGDWSKAGLEAEASKAAQAKGTEMRGSFLVPHDVLVAESRDLTIGTGTGDQLVATNLMAGSFIDLLRNRMVVKQAGARIMAGLVGDVAIPKRSTGTTAYWVDEDGEPTESATAFTQVSLSPKTIGAYEDLSRKLLLQSTPDAEMLVRDDIAQTLALGIDLACLHGTGLNDQPTGIAATSGIGSVVGGTNGAAPAWDDIVNLETEVAVDNADVGSLAYITNAKVRGKLKQTPKVASTDSVMIWADGAYPLNGYQAYVSNQVSSTLTKGTSTAKCSAIFYGNWNDLMIGLWGGLDILVNPFTLSTTGQVRIVAFQSCDIAVRYAQSFAAMLDALTA